MNGILFALILPLSLNASVGGKLRYYTTIFTTDSQEFFYPHRAGKFYLNKGDARIHVEGTVGENIDYFIRADFIYMDVPSVEKLSDTEGIGWGKINSFDLVLYEAYFKVEGFGLENLDLKLGKQRLKWGKADKIHVLDNINPSDWANFVTFDPDYFGESIPTPVLSLTYYFSDYVNLEVNYTFSFKPASFPLGFWEMAGEVMRRELVEEFPLFEGSSINVVQNLEMPAWRPDNNPWGIRLFGTVFNIDYALSYFRGFFDMPVISEISGNIQTFPVAVSVTYGYPSLQVVGLEFSGELFSIGWWGELGIFIPEDWKFKNLLTSETCSAFEKAYVKFVAGLDYTFSVGNGIYTNFQYIHGFFDEMDFTQRAENSGLGRPGFESEIEDYYLMRGEYQVISEVLKVGLSFLLNVSDYSDFLDSNSYAIFPELEYYPVDSLSIKAGSMIVDGKPSTKFGLFKKFDMVYVLAEFTF